MLAFVAAACPNASSTAPTGDGTTWMTNSTGSSDSDDGDGDDDAHQTDHVSGDTSVVEAEDEEDQFYFKPSTIIGNAGQSIVIGSRTRAASSTPSRSTTKTST